MPNIVSLHARQVFAAAGVPAQYARAYFYLSGTNTQLPVYSDPELLYQHSQPVEADANGVLPPCFVASSAAMRILITDQGNAQLPGYPMDHITPETTETTGASGISFEPTGNIPATNVQDAIQAVDGRISDQAAIYTRPWKAWTTGGTGDNYTITPNPAITAYQSGQAFLVVPTRTNTTNVVTLDINGLGPRQVRKYDNTGAIVALLPRDVVVGRPFWAIDDGTRIMMLFGQDMPSRGTNYERWLDGRQVATGTLTAKGPISTAEGSLFKSASIDLGAWPVPFAVGTVPRVTYNVWRAAGASSPTWIAELSDHTNTAGGSIALMRAVNAAATDFVISWRAEGRYWI